MSPQQNTPLILVAVEQGMVLMCPVLFMSIQPLKISVSTPVPILPLIFGRVGFKQVTVLCSGKPIGNSFGSQGNIFFTLLGFLAGEITYRVIAFNSQAILFKIEIMN